MKAPPGPDAGIAEVVIHSDGSCLGNPGPGGWGAVLRDHTGERELSGGFRATTNNRMELRAVVEALGAIEQPSRVRIHTDSQYVRQGITTWVKGWQRNGWITSQKQPVKNRDLWQALLAAVARHDSGGGVQWFWVRGHAGDRQNERADRLATAAARRVTPADPADTPLAPANDSSEQPANRGSLRTPEGQGRLWLVGTGGRTSGGRPRRSGNRRCG